MSTALEPFGHWPLFQFLNQPAGLLERGISLWQGRYLHTEYTHTQTSHALSVIRTHELSVRAGEDGSCLRPPATVIGHKTEILVKNPTSHDTTYKYDNIFSQRQTTHSIVSCVSVLLTLHVEIIGTCTHMKQRNRNFILYLKSDEKQ
jgi:hypothetical protein